MTRRMYWGVAILIILLATATVFIIVRDQAENRKWQEEMADAIDLVNRIEQRKVSEDTPLADKEGDEWVLPDNHLNKVKTDEVVPEPSVDQRQTPIFVDGEFDLVVKLPTDTELPRYSKFELGVLVYDAHNEWQKAQDKYVKLTTSLREEMEALSDDKKAGIIDSKYFWAKWREINAQSRELTRVYFLRRSEHKENIGRIKQYMKTLEE